MMFCMYYKNLPLESLWFRVVNMPLLCNNFSSTDCIFYNLQAAEEESTEADSDTTSVQTASTPTPSETTEPQSPDRGAAVSSNSDNPATDSAAEDREPKSANTDNDRTEEESNQTDEVDEGVDLQGKKDDERKGTNLRFLELLSSVNFLQ